MSGLLDHLVMGPILAPMVAGAGLLLLDERRRILKGAISLGTMTLVLIMALVLLGDSAAGAPAHVYHLGGWQAPFGIVLVADRLSTLMLALASYLGGCALVFAFARWDRAGPRFHAIFLFLIMGVNGALLTGDLFNLFVFFEIMLAASYGLLLHGSGERRIGAGLAYIAVNLTASLLFLIGVSLVYGATGTLNMADLVGRMANLAQEDRSLLHVGAAILATAFLIKCGMWPIGLWLAPAYTAASAPAAAVFAILSKVGVYVMIRLSLLLFGATAGASAGFGQLWLFGGGLATLAFGTVGLLAARDLARAAAYAVLASSGTVLMVLGSGEALAGALYYLVGSTLACGATFLIAEIFHRHQDGGGEAERAVFADEYRDPFDDKERNEPGLVIPAAVAGIGGAYILAVLMVAGLPPLAGFVGKLAMLQPMIETASPAGWTVVAALSLSTLGALIGLVRLGVAAIWTPAEDEPGLVVGATEFIAIGGLLTVCVLLSVAGGPVLAFAEATVDGLIHPQVYVSAVLGGGS
jgi:multicomponent K+:H+ antiporter subunit D